MRHYPPTMRDLLRRLRRWMFPPSDPSTRAALDGGPGPDQDPCCDYYECEHG